MFGFLYAKRSSIVTNWYLYFWFEHESHFTLTRILSSKVEGTMVDLITMTQPVIFKKEIVKLSLNNLIQNRKVPLLFVYKL